nr:ArsO family NAD(P)H-dependent flavin-containing monooxygenase [Falsiroseomonas tokyonensis]
MDVAIIGGGQAGLAAGYFLRRTALSFAILDDGAAPGGAWAHGWDSLTLFSPAAQSSLPGWAMPPPPGGGYPTRDQVLAYLAAYEARYTLPVRRPVRVTAVQRGAEGLWLEGAGLFARAVISATGTWRQPFIPAIPGRALFRGLQLHSAQYRRPEALAGRRVLVVGGGNSGAQILAELSRHAAVTWVTERPPVFLPDDIDGAVLFERATARWQAQREGRAPPEALGGLGSIVAVPAVREARARGVYARHLPPFARLEEDAAIWADGTRIPADAILWCTGFRPALAHLAPLGLFDAAGHVAVAEDGQALAEKRLFLLGYGDWTGMASATLAGVTRAARSAVQGVARLLG